MGDKVNLFNPHDGLTGRDGGPYLDVEERRLAEIRRAAVEGREPDFDNAPAVAGTPLVTAGQLVAMANPASNPSQIEADPTATAFGKLAEDESFPVSAVAERELTDKEEEQAQAKEDGDDHLNNPANPTTVSEDPEDNSGDPTEGASDLKGVDETTKSTAPAAKKTTAPAKKTASAKVTDSKGK